MECREIVLKQTLEGLEATNIPLVALENGSYIPAGYTDDLGIYYFIPLIAKWLGITADRATDLFLGSLLALSVSFAVLSFFFLFKNWLQRAVIIGYLLLALRYSDVYIAPLFAVCAVIPCYILWDEQKAKFEKFWFLYLVWSGIVIGYCNLIRLHAGTGVLLFLLAGFIFNIRLRSKEKIGSALVLLLFTTLPYLHFKYLENQRDQFLTPSYPARTIAHPKWHSIYIGFGFLKNSHGIEYSDAVANHKAASIDPNVHYCSPEYEKILKKACFQLVKADPLFVLKTILAKIFRLLVGVAVFANLGLVLAFFYVKPSFRSILPFILAVSFYALSGILTMPYMAYVTGMVSISIVFGIYMICLAIQKYQVSKLVSAMRSS